MKGRVSTSSYLLACLSCMSPIRAGRKKYYTDRDRDGKGGEEQKDWILFGRAGWGTASAEAGWRTRWLHPKRRPPEPPPPPFPSVPFQEGGARGWGAGRGWGFGNEFLRLEEKADEKSRPGNEEKRNLERGINKVFFSHPRTT